MSCDVDGYYDIVKSTNRLAEDDSSTIAIGLFGEVGSVMSTIKKCNREGEAFAHFQNCLVEEMGDVIWYLTALMQSHGISKSNARSIICENIVSRSEADRGGDEKMKEYRNSLTNIGRISASLLECNDLETDKRVDLIRQFLVSYFIVLSWHGICLYHVLKANSQKIDSYFGKFNILDLPEFESDFPLHERFPEKFEIEIKEDQSGSVSNYYNGRRLGDPLTDNIGTEDGFRYHDILHFSHIAILHWSPTMRGLMRVKRKSDPSVDENEDGGRAVVIEEGLAAWVFSRAKDLDYFKDHNDISIDILKTISGFVRGYEVERCPMSLWRHCILSGYSVFREARANKGGIVVGDRSSRTLKYKELRA